MQHVLLRNLIRTGIVCIGIAAAAAPAAATDVVLENLTYDRGPEGSAAIPRVEITGSNLERADIEKLFAQATPKEERKALAARLKADRIAMPQLIVTAKRARITMSDFLAEGIDRGRAAHIAISGIAGDFTSGKGEKGTLKTGAIKSEGANFVPYVDASASAMPDINMAPFSHFSLQGVEVTMPDPKVPQTQPGGNLFRIRMESFVADGTYDGNVPLKGTGIAKGITFEPPPGSEAAMGLGMAGLQKLEFGLTFDGTYDPASRTYALDDYTITGVDIGSLGLKARLANVPKEAFTAEKEAKLQALLSGGLSSVQLRFVNAGIFEKAVAFYALQQQKTPSAVKEEWSMMVTQMLPMVLGGDPGAVGMARAISAFIQNPKAITITAKAKGEPLGFREMGAIRDPMALLQRVELGAVDQ